MRQNLPLIFLVLAAPVFVSCAAVKNSAATASAKVAELSRSTRRGLGNLMPGTKIPVVAVREKDLREMPLANERILAYEKSRKNGWFGFGGPVDFVEPEMPTSGGESDDILLPPKDTE